MAFKGKRVEAVAYIRTSSAANVGADKDSDKRQRAAIKAELRAWQAGAYGIPWFGPAYLAGACPSPIIGSRPIARHSAML